MDDPRLTGHPNGHPDEQPAGVDGTPRFGRLLLVLVLAVALVGGLTFLSQWLYS